MTRTIVDLVAALSAVWATVATTLVIPAIRRNRIDIERNVKVDIELKQLSDSTKRLLRTTLSHERRLYGLEVDRERFHGKNGILHPESTDDE